MRLWHVLNWSDFFFQTEYDAALITLKNLTFIKIQLHLKKEIPGIDSICNMLTCCIRCRVCNWHQGEKSVCGEKVRVALLRCELCLHPFNSTESNVRGKCRINLRIMLIIKTKSISLEVWIKSLTGWHVNPPWVVVKRSSKHEKVKSYIMVHLSHQSSIHSNMSTRLWSCTCHCVIHQHFINPVFGVTTSLHVLHA